jgi:hypothetical protein
MDELMDKVQQKETFETFEKEFEDRLLRAANRDIAKQPKRKILAQILAFSMSFFPLYNCSLALRGRSIE